MCILHHSLVQIFFYLNINLKHCCHLIYTYLSEVLKNLLSEAKTKEIPVVVISADALLDQVEKLRRAGARDYLTKPLDVIHFLETVDQYLMVS